MKIHYVKARLGAHEKKTAIAAMGSVVYNFVINWPRILRRLSEDLISPREEEFRQSLFTISFKSSLIEF